MRGRPYPGTNNINSGQMKSKSLIITHNVHDLKPWDKPDSSWNKAALSTLQADPFCCRTEWQLSFYEAFSPGRTLYLRESTNSLLAFARIDNRSPHKLFIPVESLWLFGCPLLGPESVDLMQETIQESNRPRFLISGLRPGGRLFRQLRERFTHQYNFRLYSRGTLCGASLSGGLDGFLSRRSSNHRRNLNKEMQRAIRKGVYFERYVPTSEKEVDEIYARIIHVERKSWKGIGQCGMAEQPALSYYYLMLKRLALSRSARIIIAKHKERDIGFIYGGLSSHIYRGQQFSFSEDWRKASIGNLLQLEQIRWLCDEGVRRYDMGPMMGYKKHWTERKFNIQAWLLEPL